MDVKIWDISGDTCFKTWTVMGKGKSNPPYSIGKEKLSRFLQNICLVEQAFTTI